MAFAHLGPIAIAFPKRLETNAQLQEEFPEWDLPQIEEKTGIAARYIAEPSQCASDLAVEACEKLFAENQVDRSEIDFLLLCTQTPDYPLPTTACLLQNRLGLSTSIGALDFNLGCSGFVYGLSLADGLIRSGVAKKILLVTADTYSKYIDRGDRSLRTIFGDAAAATLIEARPEQEISGFVFGTDGSGADTLLVGEGGSRHPEEAIKPRNRKRWKSRLYMDGPSLMAFTVEAIPRLVEAVAAKAGITKEAVDWFLLHQASYKMLSQLQARIGYGDEKIPIRLRDYGNTVSCTIPVLIHDMRKRGEIKAGMTLMLVGFGVGWSWGGCVWRETHAPCHA